MKRLHVELKRLADHSYDIHLGHNILDRLPPLLARNKWGDRYVVITDETVESIHGEAFCTRLANAGLLVERLAFPAGEKSKNMETILKLAERLLDLRCDRASCLIALGGGVVGDITGFLASIYMRGISYLQVPTTLLAQVDSCIGGKTGVDIPAGKNLLGTFYQPKAVFVDTAFLSTLPEVEYRNGLAEIVKYGLIDSSELFQFLEEKKKDILSRQKEVLDLIILESCRIKKGIVELDEREAGIRRILNFGHTIGHAIERALNYDYPHGQAVSIGMVAAARLSEAMGYLHSRARTRIEKLLEALELPCHLPFSVTPENILTGIQADKKQEKGEVNFVLLKEIGLPFVRGKIKEDLIAKVLRELAS
ncbi:MAG TPA: 3-dehydroquinate synthase [Syntrophales bacterium]|nr:3-dehydroquinate synthase [Syntrophales bacterium]HOL58817.1 3-dehydroquinate synthase [Syntrophales bacterium]HPO35144.1 3-dehydroquinate synthase [Syntrophales bacterium]